MRRKLIAALFVLLPSVAFADCPIGSYPWTDMWGNQICREENPVIDLARGYHRSVNEKGAMVSG